jgi:hypothetical protein
MIVYDFYVVSITVPPHETNSPLLIDSNAVLSIAITPQRLKAVSRRHSQIKQFGCGVKHLKLIQRLLLNLTGKPLRMLLVENLFGFFAPKIPDHACGKVRLRSILRKQSFYIL